MSSEEQEHLADLLEDDSDRLSSSEVDFIESLSHRPPAYELSEKQAKWLDSIWRRICG